MLWLNKFIPGMQLVHIGWLELSETHFEHLSGHGLHYIPLTIK